MDIKNTKNKYYVVYSGRNIGIYDNWDDCQKQITGYPNAVFKGFFNLEVAEKSFNDYKKSLKFSLKNISELETALKKYKFIFFIDGSYQKNEININYFTSGIVIFFKNKFNQLVQIKIKKKFSNFLLAKINNIAGEIMSAAYVMKYILSFTPSNSLICHDYIGISEFCRTWNSQNSIIKIYQQIYQRNFLNNDNIKLNFLKVQAHSDNPYINLADKLAKEAYKITNFSETLGEKKVFFLKFSDLSALKIQKILENNFLGIKISLVETQQFSKKFSCIYNNLKVELLFKKRGNDLTYLNFQSNIENFDLFKKISNYLIAHFLIKYNGLNDYFFINLKKINNFQLNLVNKIIQDNFSNNDYKTFIISNLNNKFLIIENFSPIKLIYCFCLIYNLLVENKNDPLKLFIVKIVNLNFDFDKIINFIVLNYDSLKDFFLKISNNFNYQSFDSLKTVIFFWKAFNEKKL